MLVHICCSVDSHYFLQKLRADLPDENLVGYFYDPNIHPYSEFLLRFEDVKRSCDKLGIKLICGDYDYDSWLQGTKGLEDEPEKGKRCSYCFDFRVGNSAKKATEIGEKTITTTLLMSPKKDFEQLTNSLKKAVENTQIEIYAKDYRKNGGTNEQFTLAKKDKLYHQNYCGCIFGLSKQREAQKLPLSELCSEINARIMPGSIEERLELYKNVRECEEKGIIFTLKRNSFLNYRLLRAFVRFDSKTIPSYFMLYSNFKRNFIKFNLQEQADENTNLRDGIVLLSISRFNTLFNTNFKDTTQLCKNPLSIENELKIREELSGTMSLNPIIILDDVKLGKYEIYAKNELYQDSKEILKILDNK
ncbi:putative DUF208 domain protein [Campylobacter pinnipediorum subsp. pinnipediorum]|uniref:epoxyqueuosine reductase QueH n=1 Tax=Campylobacter pinnipediorum TaxID=1965231 RepID=UPI000994AD63|nr:epoxyqueuosine reductase QueH [Campylobacter pinnipediorum]AQW83785.1 putative DUF208 domain protein [Campylobacter pinnipediorum subsp. pinnipediorum]